MARKLFISLSIFLLTASQALADVVVIVRREAEATGNYVRVCDIARVEGPRDQASAVGRMVLGPTPPKGETLEISRWDIESRLYEMGIAARVTFSGNDTVKVFGDGNKLRIQGRDTPALQELDPLYAPTGLRFGDADEFAAKPDSKATAVPAAIGKKNTRGGSPLDDMTSEARDRVAKTISKYLAGHYKRSDIEVESTLLSLSEAVPAGAAVVEVDAPLECRVPGKATLRLKVKDSAESPVRQVTVAADAQVFGLAPVAARKLERGETLSSRDVKIDRVKMEFGQGYMPPDAGAIEGRTVKADVPAGAPVLASNTALAELVKRGDKVTNQTPGSGWTVQSMATAHESGKLGDIITVEDAHSKKKYQAKVIGNKTVSTIGEITK